MTKPKPIHSLTSQQWDFLNKEMRKPPTEQQKDQIKHALEVYHTIEKNTCLDCKRTKKYLVKCPKGLLRCNQYLTELDCEKTIGEN